MLIRKVQSLKPNCICAESSKMGSDTQVIGFRASMRLLVIGSLQSNRFKDYFNLRLSEMTLKSIYEGSLQLWWKPEYKRKLKYDVRTKKLIYV